MAHPWIFQARHDGAATPFGWDSEADTDGIMDMAHYKTLARLPWVHAAPFEGAYALRVAPAGGTNEALVKEGDINLANTETHWFRFPLQFGTDFAGTADDTFQLFELEGSGPAITVAMGARIVTATGVINLGVGGANTGAVPTVFGSRAIERGVWYTCEIRVVIQTGGSGTVDLYITKDGGTQETNAEASISSVTNIVVTDGYLGLKAHDATTTGTILFGEFVQDDTQLFAKKRYDRNPILNQTGHAFVGPGTIAGAAQLTDEGTQVMTVYDSDDANTNVSLEPKLIFDAENQTSYGGELKFNKGCYVVVAGTDPMVQIQTIETSLTPGVFGPLYFGGDSMVRHLARRS